jgi:hypothetical protein
MFRFVFSLFTRAKNEVTYSLYRNGPSRPEFQSKLRAEGWPSRSLTRNGMPHSVFPYLSYRARIAVSRPAPDQA